MKIKKLNWRDNVTELGKNSGLFEIIADISEIGLSYHIRNYKYGGDPIYDKFYLFCENTAFEIECDSIDEAKEKAQKNFTQTVLNLFFE